MMTSPNPADNQLFMPKLDTHRVTLLINSVVGGVFPMSQDWHVDLTVMPLSLTDCPLELVPTPADGILLTLCITIAHLDMLIIESSAHYLLVRLN
jgi:hypothetical protein